MNGEINVKLVEDELRAFHGDTCVLEKGKEERDVLFFYRVKEYANTHGLSYLKPCEFKLEYPEEVSGLELVDNRVFLINDCLVGSQLFYVNPNDDNWFGIMANQDQEHYFIFEYHRKRGRKKEVCTSEKKAQEMLFDWMEQVRLRTLLT